MNKSEFVEVLAVSFEGNRAQARRALDAVITTLTDRLANGERVVLSGFGAFQQSIRTGREVRNPRTGEIHVIADRTIPKFVPGGELKNVVAGVTTAAKRATAKKSTAKKTAAKKSAAKKATAKRTTAAKKATAKKSTAKKTTAKKATAKKSPAKKTTAKKATARRSPARATAGV